ncbi:M24 family metallopeptidase [Meiothermus granaticius]|uniref:Aminopeptidase YpdF n=1 Tax=Meiothermus granaticius NBRC 107808 TaxID=1227551 RepID=A0A399F9G0_9DEIN|nr:M24 family metallopeptidase [Meiothermus granaticius]RIH91271.1 Aminopeptidase YpdF [Meiothermus granaticius NBRC 107808]GEM86078.1 peptidase M24 [Meiothermus granaticius NBRC 107808]
MFSDTDLYAEKLAQAQQELKEGELWLIATRENLEHPEPALSLLSGAHLTWDTFFLLSRHKATAIAGRFDAPSIEAPWQVQIYDEDYTALLRSEVAAHSPQRILLDYSPNNPMMDGLSHGMYLKLKAALPEAEFGSAAEFLGGLRSAKTPAEQARIKAAVEMAEAHLEELSAHLHLGWSELQAMEYLHERLREEGLEPAWGWNGCPNISFGRMPSHAGATEKRLEPGMLIHTDYGVRMRGYCSDLQRVYYWPRPGEGVPEEVTRAFPVVRRAIDRAAEQLRPGVKGYEVDAVARATITDAGYPEYKYATGHNLGRATHDGGTLLGPRWPRYGQSPEGRVREDEVYTLELGVMLEGLGYVGLEEDVVVRPNGAEWLSRRQEAVYCLEP